MLFNSTEYLIFLPVVLFLHHLVRNQIHLRNPLLLAASYVFYGWWSLWFLLLMLLSSTADYYLGKSIAASASPARKRLILVASVVMNLGILFYFKYHGFFIDSINPLLGTLGFENLRTAAQVTLPVGISFYTFQSISYIVDVYRGVIVPPKKLVDYLVYVAFFPQLVAGPIERSPHLLPQFAKILPTTAAHFREGAWLILWGLFKKVVIADNLAPLVDLVYTDARNATGPLILLATISFGIQIYCDFSGYSDVARGSGKLLGFDIMFNFRIPYGSTNIQEFWNRWHISLSSWFRDYVYIPLGGNRRGMVRTLINLLIVMLLAGLWHGAAVTFLLWGLLHAIALIVHRLWIATKPEGMRLPHPISWLLTMAVVFSAWAFFRAASLDDLFLLAHGLSRWTLPSSADSYLIALGSYIALLTAVESYETRRRNPATPDILPPWPRAILQSIMLMLLILNWDKEGSPFIYFQF